MKCKVKTRTLISRVRKEGELLAEVRAAVAKMGRKRSRRVGKDNS